MLRTLDHQGSYADSEFNNKHRETRKEQFLGPMEELIPWQRLESVITPHYPKADGPKPYPCCASTVYSSAADWQIAEIPDKLNELIETTRPQSGSIESRVSESQYSGQS